ncbi:MAG: lytic transglycosylase domain-containing protein [Thermoanaerobaculia bacterium]
MTKPKISRFDALSVRMSIAKDRLTRRRSRGRFQTKRTMTLILGAALSVGGVGEAFDRVQFLVEKDLDQTTVVRRTGGGEKVVARISDGFAANSVYKIARAVPDTILAERRDLFDASWLGLGDPPKINGNSEELTLLTQAVREDFFRTLPYGDIIHTKAEKYDVDPALVAAVIEAESRFKQRAVSPRGARGLMQLMPRTGRWMGARDLYNPEQNVDAGVKYLKYLNERFDGNLKKTIAAYNAGEGTVKRYGGIPPYRETRTYVKRVMNNYEKRNRELERFSAERADDAEAR